MSIPSRPDDTSPPCDASERLAPVYSQIEVHLRSIIQSGEFAPGDRLPSESELARKFRTTRTTVRQALTRLVFEGLITRHVGRGSFVATSESDKFPIDSRVCICFEEQVALEGKKVTYRAPSFEIVALPADAARQLRLPAGVDAFKLERIRVIDGRPVCLEVRYIPLEIGRRVTGDMLVARSAHAFVGEIIGARIPTIRVLISAIVADARLSDLLELPRNSAVLIRDNVHFDAEGAPVMCGASYFRGDVRTEYVLGHDPNPPRLPE